MKHSILFAALLSIFVMTSCNSKDDLPKKGTYADRASYVTTHVVESLSEDDKEVYFFELDNGSKLFLADNKLFNKYDFEDGKRVAIYYYIMEEYADDDTQSEGTLYDCDYAMRLFNVFNVIEGSSVVIENDDDNEALANHAVSYIYQNIGIGYGYLNFIAGIKAKDIEDVSFYLALNKADMPDDDDIDDDYLYLDLRYDRGSDEATGNTTENFVSISLDSFASELSGKKGVKLRVRTLQSQDQGPFYITLDIDEDQRKAASMMSRSAADML